MSEYQVVYIHPNKATTGLKTTEYEYPNEIACIEGIEERGGIFKVKAISSRLRHGLEFKRLNGPGYLRLWQEDARQK